MRGRETGIRFATSKIIKGDRTRHDYIIAINSRTCANLNANLNRNYSLINIFVYKRNNFIIVEDYITADCVTRIHTSMNINLSGPKPINYELRTGDARIIIKVKNKNTLSLSLTLSPPHHTPYRSVSPQLRFIDTLGLCRLLRSFFSGSLFFPVSPSSTTLQPVR